MVPNCATHGSLFLLRVCVRHHVRVCLRPFFTFSAPVLHPLSAHRSRFLPLFLSLRAVLRAPIKESRPTPVCAPDTIASLFPSSRSLEPLLFLSLRRRLSPAASHLTPHLFSQASPLATANRRRCVEMHFTPELHFAYASSRPDGRVVEISWWPVRVRDRWRMK